MSNLAHANPVRVALWALIGNKENNMQGGIVSSSLQTLSDVKTLENQQQLAKELNDSSMGTDKNARIPNNKKKDGFPDSNESYTRWEMINEMNYIGEQMNKTTDDNEKKKYQTQMQAWSGTNATAEAMNQASSNEINNGVKASTQASNADQNYSKSYMDVLPSITGIVSSVNNLLAQSNN